MGRTLGQVAYEAYGDARGWVTATGGRMPDWDDQRTELKEAWGAAAYAAVMAHRAANVVITMDESDDRG